MDHWGEIITLGVDTIVFSVCAKLYFRYCHTVNVVQKAQELGINPNLKDLSEDSRGYVIVQGDVKALVPPIKSLNAPDVTGVVQKLTIKEHAIARNASGFWSDQKRIIKEAYNVVRFMIQRGNMEVEIIDPLSAEMLDLDTIHDKFESSSLGIMDHVVGFFNGVRQRGVETTEEFLKEGTVITAIGEIRHEAGNRYQMSPPSNGYPYFISSLPVTSLIRRLEKQRRTFKWLTLVFGGIGLTLVAIFAKRWLITRQARIKDEEVKRKLQDSRKERRRNVRHLDDLTENQRCVVCRVNPKEIIVLPCGHVSLCEDCSENINNDCPVCRTPIMNKAAAFIS